eukprot:gene840-822_t
MTEWLNPTQKVELASFMLALTASWVDSLGNEQGQRSAWEKLWSFLKNTDVTLESFSFSAGAAQVEADATAIQVGANFGPLSTNIKLALQNDQQFRSTLEDALKKNKTGFVKQLHDFVRELKIELCPHQEKCVLLIDSLEKIVGGGENTKEVLSSVLQLFEQQSSVLQLPLMHVVYSIPPFILRQNRQLPARLGNAADVSLPSVHVFKRKPYTVDRSEQGGQSKLRRLLSMRYPPWSNFFTEDQINAIIENTGGDIRDYLRTLQLCLLKVSPEQARVTETHIQTAFDRIRPNMDLPEQEKHWLARVNDTHESCLGEHIDVYTLESYIKTKHVLAYMNGETWYGAHGVLQRLNEMRQLLLRSPHLYLIALPSSSALGAARLASDLWSVRSLVLSAQGQNWRAQRSPSWDQEITGTTTPSADASTPTIKAWCHHHAQWSTLADSSNRSRLSLQMGLQAMADAIALRRFEQAQTIGKQVIQVSQFQQDDLGRANALQALGDLDRRLGQIASARALYTQAIALYEKEQNDLGRANALRALGDLDSRLGQVDSARGLYTQAIALYEKEQNDLGRANALQALGDLDSRLGQVDSARTRYTQAIALYEKEQHNLGRANALQALGDLDHRLGQVDSAQTRYTQAIALYETEQDHMGLAYTWAKLARLSTPWDTLMAHKAKKHAQQSASPQVINDVETLLQTPATSI